MAIMILLTGHNNVIYNGSVSFTSSICLIITIFSTTIKVFSYMHTHAHAAAQLIVIIHSHACATITRAVTIYCYTVTICYIHHQGDYKVDLLTSYVTF